MNKIKRIQTGALLMTMLLMATIIVPAAVAIESTEQIKIKGIDDVVKTKIVSYNDIKKGDIIATGKRNNSKDLCQVAFGTTITFGPDEHGTKSIVTKVDDNCNIIVSEKNESTESIASSSGAMITSLKSINEDYWMYGYGGTWDKLTEDTSAMTFGYDGSSAWSISGSGNCIPHSLTGWVNTYCRAWIDPSSGDFTQYNVHGDFHWLNNYYTHDLWTALDGRKSGSADCSYTYSGSIVSGTTHTCTV